MLKSWWYFIIVKELSLLRNLFLIKPKFLTWLPLSHSYEHTVQFVQIAVGARVFYAESIDKLIKNMTIVNQI